jgi:CheY-like chemotaxis protein
MPSLPDTRPAPAETGAGAPVTSFTVLLVDDDDAVRKVTARYLARLGYSVVEAADGRRALQLTGPDSRIDLVLSDIALPGMRGPVLLSALRARCPSLRAVLMTGYAPEALQPEYWPPDTGFLAKPFTPGPAPVPGAAGAGARTPLYPRLGQERPRCTPRASHRREETVAATELDNPGGPERSRHETGRRKLLVRKGYSTTRLDRGQGARPARTSPYRRRHRRQRAADMHGPRPATRSVPRTRASR